MQEEIDTAAQILFERMKALGKGVPELIVLPSLLQPALRDADSHLRPCPARHAQVCHRHQHCRGLAHHRRHLLRRRPRLCQAEGTVSTSPESRLCLLPREPHVTSQEIIASRVQHPSCSAHACTITMSVHGLCLSWACVMCHCAGCSQCVGCDSHRAVVYFRTCDD